MSWKIQLAYLNVIKDWLVSKMIQQQAFGGLEFELNQNFMYGSSFEENTLIIPAENLFCMLKVTYSIWL